MVAGVDGALAGVDAAPLSVGCAGGGEAWREVGGYAGTKGASVGGGAPGSAGAGVGSQRHRFGGIKTLVQNLTGRT